ncbi:hypothetical protein AAMO2058_000214100 [Amorphochlora amoebiformis]
MNASLEPVGNQILQVKKVEEAMKGLFTGAKLNVDIKLRDGMNIYIDTEEKNLTEIVDSLGGTKLEKDGLLPPLMGLKRGLKTISIQIQSIGLKDALTYIDPFITISLVSQDGKSRGPRQNTKKTHQVRDRHVLFDQTVHIQTPLNNIHTGDSIFFEFKHYKPKKKYISTRCFAFMEYDEIIAAQKKKSIQLEIYKKPTNFLKKNLNLFSVKKLYLNLSVIFHKH